MRKLRRFFEGVFYTVIILVMILVDKLKHVLREVER